jgi:hypothetical protein
MYQPLSFTYIIQGGKLKTPLVMWLHLFSTPQKINEYLNTYLVHIFITYSSYQFSGFWNNNINFNHLTQFS